MTGARLTMPDVEPPLGSPADVDRELVSERTRLIELARAHVPTVRGFIEVEGHVYSIDVFLVGVANRSFYLVTGFIDALDQWNIFAAAPLVRLQVDSLLRVSYVTRAPRADHVVDHVLKGRSFRDLRDEKGRRLTDQRLVELAVTNHPWVPSVYSDANAWIHLSTIQVFPPWELAEEGKMTMQFPMRHVSIPRDFLRGMVSAMTEATDDLLTYLEAWRRRKGLPLGIDRP